MFGEKKFGLNIPQKINKKLSEIRKIFKGNLEPGWPWIKLEQVKPGLAMTGTVLAAISDAKKRVFTLWSDLCVYVWCLNRETEFQHLDAFAFFQ